MIRLQSISKRYGNIQALRDLTLNVPAGCTMGLLGKNGAGKSTLMNILVGNLRQDQGSVEINGIDLHADPIRAKQTFGYLPENVPAYSEMTIREYLRFAAELNRVPKKEQKKAVDTALERMSLTDLSTRLIGGLSKGQKQRAGIAQAVFCTPAKIIVLDEPTSGLDPSQIVQFRTMLKEMKGEYTILLSSHILSDVRDVCDEIAVIDSGRLVVQGRMDDLIERYASYTTLELIVKGGVERIVERLRSFEGIDSVEIIELTRDLDTKICVKSGSDMRDMIFHAAVETDTVLLGMTAPESTLDNIFARVTALRQEEQ